MAAVSFFHFDGERAEQQSAADNGALPLTPESDYSPVSTRVWNDCAYQLCPARPGLNQSWSNEASAAWAGESALRIGDELKAQELGPEAANCQVLRQGKVNS